LLSHSNLGTYNKHLFNRNKRKRVLLAAQLQCAGKVLLVLKRRLL